VEGKPLMQTMRLLTPRQAASGTGLTRSPATGCSMSRQAGGQCLALRLMRDASINGRGARCQICDHLAIICHRYYAGSGSQRCECESDVAKGFFQSVCETV
jgi:hypothetical protein